MFPIYCSYHPVCGPVGTLKEQIDFGQHRCRGPILFFAKSPPPITLPALADAILTLLDIEKKLCLNAEVINSIVIL